MQSYIKLATVPCRNVFSKRVGVLLGVCPEVFIVSMLAIIATGWMISLLRPLCRLANNLRPGTGSWRITLPV